MKKLIYFSKVFIFIAAFSAAAAFGQTATPGSAPNPTPVSRPNAGQIHLRINSEWAQVRQCVKSGLLTQSDANNLATNLRSVSRQKTILLKRDYGRDLSDSQTAQLNDTLDEIQKTLTAAGGQPATRYHH
ncbi:MAG TPA: hypothetical protein VK791_06535 [bacterium]|nr:hypothetical protein [bacterium]